MKIRSIKFYLQEGFVSLFKNRLMTLASIATIASCIFLFIGSYCAIANVNFLLDQVKATVGVTVFAEDGITDDNLLQLEESLKKVANVTSVKYIPPDEALKSMEEDFEANADILEGLENDNPLSKSFEIKVANVESSKQVIEEIKALPNVRKVNEAEELVSVLINTSKILSIVGIVVVIILSVISIVIVMNTIKLTVYVRRKEINIMKYVGATDWFIRWPFIIEGIFIGIFGSAIPAGIMWFAYSRIIARVGQMPIISGIFTLLDTWQIFPFLAPICVGAGALLGMFGSIYSVRKHLNV